MEPTFVSFYTIGTPYEQEAQNLIESLKQHNLEYIVEGIEDRGSWKYNCLAKGNFCLRHLTKLQKPIVWLDCDAVIEQKPILFSDCKADFAAYISRTKPLNMLAGTMFFNYTDKSIDLLLEWSKRCELEQEAYPGAEFDESDQGHLNSAWLYLSQEHNINIDITPIPVTYAKVFDIPFPEATVIRHKFKNFISKGK